MFEKSDGISRLQKGLIVLCAALGSVMLLSAQEPWPPVSAEDMAMKDHPQEPGAAAVCLLKEVTTDHESFVLSVFKRVKVLTSAGRDEANIEIPYYRGRHLVQDIKARVVPTQGHPEEFAGQIFEKTVLRTRGIRMAVKSFALPNVEPGSIIDYRYRIVPDRGGSSGKDVDEALAELRMGKRKPEEGGIAENQEVLSMHAEHWDLQEDLFIRRAKFLYLAYPQIGVFFKRGCYLSWVGHNLGNVQPVIKGSRVTLEVENIPAFKEEEFMTPEESEKMSVDIFYLDLRITDSDDFWRRESESWQKAAEDFIGKPSKLAVEAQAIAGDVEGPTERLKKIYERAQRLRNLSYEKGQTRKQRKEQKIRVNRSATEVLERGYGLRSDITRTFVALARAAGFEADVARILTRDDKLFRIKLLDFYGQLDSEAALVKLGDEIMIFDPATPFCPFGLIHWSRSDTAAVHFSEKPPAFFKTATYAPDLALTQREVVLQLDTQGNLAGTVKTTYQGHEALVRRLDYIHDDREDIRKSLEEELMGLLPMGAAVTMKQLDNIDNNDPAVVVQYEVAISGLVTFAGDRVLLPASPLLGSRQYPFRHAERKFPVYFPYPFREFNDIIINLPGGLTADTLPGPKKSKNEFSSYVLLCVQEAPQRLHVQRDLIIQKIFFPVMQYASLKSFYDMVRSNDETQVILAKEKK